MIKLGTTRAAAFRALLSPPFLGRQTSMRMHPGLACLRFLFLRRIPFAVPPKDQAQPADTMSACRPSSLAKQCATGGL